MIHKSLLHHHPYDNFGHLSLNEIFDFTSSEKERSIAMLGVYEAVETKLIKLINN